MIHRARSSTTLTGQVCWNLLLRTVWVAIVAESVPEESPPGAKMFRLKLNSLQNLGET